MKAASSLVLSSLEEVKAEQAKSTSYQNISQFDLEYMKYFKIKFLISDQPPFEVVP